MGMRSGFRNLVGAQASRQKGSSFLVWLVVAVVVILLVLALTR